MFCSKQKEIETFSKYKEKKYANGKIKKHIHRKIKKMKNVLFLFTLLFVTSCVDFSNDNIPTTDFYVKNTSDKTITFVASVLKFSTMTTQTVSFKVNAKDSVLAREIGYSRDGTEPQSWFESFTIQPVSGIQMNDPNLAANWVKYNVNNKPIYVFTLNKN
jgi:hypothetical protein